MATKAELHALLNEKILSGGRRTTAQFVRDFLNPTIDSFLNPEDFFTGSISQYVAADGSIQDLTVGNTLFRGLWQNAPVSYKAGESVLYGRMLWLATADNIGELPGTGYSWEYQISNDDTYNDSFIGQILPVSSNRFHQVIEDLKSSIDDNYYRLDGTSPLEADMNAGGYNIGDIAGVYANHLQMNGANYGFAVAEFISPTATTDVASEATSYGGFFITNGGNTTGVFRTKADGEFQIATDYFGRWLSFATGQFTTALILDENQNAEFKGNLKLGNAGMSFILPDNDVSGGFVNVTFGSLTQTTITAIP